MRKKIIYLISALAIIAFTIALVSIITGFLNETTFTETVHVLKVNESIEQNGSNVRVMQIIYSPCPEDSQCIWSGLAATFRVQRGEIYEERQLTEGSNESIHGVRIALLEVQPESVRIQIT